MKEVRAVVVGCGWWGRSCHCYLIGLTPGITLHGVVSSSAEKREKVRAELECNTYADIDSAVADPAVDLVILATPGYTHADLAVRALDAGKNVVTEKVMCLNLAECDRMIEAAEKSGKLLTVFQNRRRDGDFLTLKKLIADGELGNLRWVEMAWQGFGAWGSWRGDSSKGGGRFYDLGAHLMDQILQLFPEKMQSVYCRMHHDFDTKDVESETMIVVGFESGATAICDVSSMAAISKPRFYARGTGATWMKHGVDPQEAAMMKSDIDSAKENPDNYGTLKSKSEEKVVPTLHGRWRDYYENIVDVIANGAEPIVKVSEARSVMAALDSALRSARTGKAICGDDIYKGQ